MRAQHSGATAGVKWLVIGQFENVARKGDGGPAPARQAAKKTVNQRDIEEDARRSPALPLRPFSCTFGTALTLRSEVEILRAASWAIASVAVAWFWIVAMMGGGPRTSTPFELRMIFERNSRMPYAANPHSALSAAVWLVAAVSMVR